MCGESRLGRTRIADLRGASARAEALALSGGDPCALVGIISGVLSTTKAQSIYAAVTLTITCQQVEGGASLIEGDGGGGVLVLNVGSVVIPQSTILLAIVKDGLYVVRYDG